MIRILDSKARKSEDYQMLANILCAGLDHFCTKNCKNCEANKVCKSVNLAAGYALILAGKHNN